MSSTARPLPNLDRHLRWLIAFRLVMISSVLLSYLVFELSSRGELPEFNLLFVLVAATYVASIVHIALLAMLATRPLWHAYIQFAGDLAPGDRIGLLLRRYHQPVLDALPGRDHGLRRHPATARGPDHRRHRLYPLRDAAHRARAQLDSGTLAAAHRSRVLLSHFLQPRGAPVRFLRRRAADLLSRGERLARRGGARREDRQPRRSRGLSSRRDPVDLERSHLDRPRGQGDHRESRRPRDPRHNRARSRGQDRSPKADCSPRPSGSPQPRRRLPAAARARSSKSNATPSGCRSALP